MTESPLTIELNPEERRLWDRLRERVIAPRRGGAGLRDVLLLLPDLTVLLFRLTRDPRVPVGAKLVAAAGVGYVLSPIDLFPGRLFGPFGLIDDLVIVSAACSRLLNQVHPDLVRAHWSGQGDVLDAIQRVSAWCESQLTGVFRGLAQRVLGTTVER